jgi:hypothetical protein
MTAMLNKLILWFKRTGRLLSLIWPKSCISGVDLHINSSTSILDITKFVHDGCQSTLCENKWACMEMCMQFCSDIMKKERLSCNELSQAINMGATL